MKLIEARLLLPPALRTPEIMGVFRKRPYPRPKEWPAPSSVENFSSKKRVNELLLEFGLAAAPILWDLADRGIGREDKGDVIGRGEEDREIGIDGVSEGVERKILERLGNKFGLSFFVFSEHESFMVGKLEKGEEPELYLFLDPYDNSDEYGKRIGDTPGFMVAGMWDKHGQPVGAAQINLNTAHIFINRDGENYEYNPRIKELKVFPETPVVRTIKDPRFIIISYDGREKYIRPFNENLTGLNRDRNPKSSFHGKAGAHGYAFQALNGGIYVIFNEPLSEGPPGWPFAISRGYKIKMVQEDGTQKDYDFNPSYYFRNPERYNKDRIPCLLVSNSPEISNEIVRYMLAKLFPGWENI